jgi:hypothetical protein
MQLANNKPFQNPFPGQLILSNNALSGSVSTEFSQMGLLELLILDGNNLAGDINEVLSGKTNLGKLHNVDSSPPAAKSLNFRFCNFRNRRSRQ